MNVTELNKKLCKESPFILKTSIDNEDHLQFNWNLVELNQKVIGYYSIEEKEDCINILLDAKGYILEQPLLIMLDYNDKPIMFTDASKSGEPVRNLEQLDRLVKLIPQVDHHKDMKAEL